MLETLCKVFFTSLFFVALAALVSGLIEPYLLKVERVSWPQPKQKQLGKANNTAAHLRVVFISDLHTEFLYIKQARVCAEIIKSKPDLIIFGGDWTGKTWQRSLKKADSWRQALVKAANKVDASLLAVTGNHDWKPDGSRMYSEDSDLKLLVNESLKVTAKDDSKWQILGFDDLKYGKQVFPANIDPTVDANKTIVVAHNPDTIINFENIPADYFFCGHFHGGQIRLPGNPEFRFLRKEKIAKMGFQRGAFLYKGKKCYISRGLGCVLMPIRFFSRPELTIFDLFAP